MEPYIVVCRSCQSKIRARNAKLVGKRVACPKCGSEVLIHAPPQPKVQVATSDAAQVDSTALTKEALSSDLLASPLQPNALQPNALQSKPPQSPRLGSLDSQADSFEHALTRDAGGLDSPFSSIDFAEIEQALDQQSKIDMSGQEAQEQLLRAYQSQDMAWTPAAPIAPTEQWSNPSTSRSRQILIIAFLGAGSCLLTGVLFVIFLRWYQADSSQKDPLAANPQNAGAVQVDSNQPAQTQLDDSALKDTASSDPALENPTGEDPESTEAASGNSAPATTPPADPKITGTQTQPGEATDAEEKVILPATSATNASSMVDANKNPVLDSGGPNEDQTESTLQPSLIKPNVPPSVQALLKVIGEPNTITEPPRLIVPEQPKVTELEIETGDRALTMTPAANLTELATQRIIRELALPQRKTSELLGLWNGVVGLPAAIYPLSLAAADYDFDAKIDMRLKESSANAAINAFSETLGLRAENRENRFWLLTAPLPDEQKLPWSVSIEELVTGDQELQWLRESIELLFPGTSAELTFEAGKLSGNASGLDRLTWFSIVRLLDNWRAQRGLPLQLTSYRRENLRVPFVTPDQVPALTQQLDEVTSTPRPLAQLINRHCTSVGLNCWVDWPALEYLPVRLTIGEPKAINPQTPRVSVTHKRQLKQFLDELDFELGMVTLLIDEKNILITSQYAYRRMPQVFVIPSQGKSIEAYWSQFLRPLTPIDSAGISNVIIRPTPDGEHLLLKCCWPSLHFE